MIVLIDTSTSVARMTIVGESGQDMIEWDAGRELAKGMLGWIEQSLSRRGQTIKDIEGIGVFAGPGSFTGLRIGITVANTLADGLSVPIVSGNGEGWRDECIRRLQTGGDDKITLPLYDREANITKPRK